MKLPNDNIIKNLLLLKNERELLKDVILNNIDTNNQEKIKKLLSNKNINNLISLNLFHNITAANDFFDITNELCKEREGFYAMIALIQQDKPLLYEIVKNKWLNSKTKYRRFWS